MSRAQELLTTMENDVQLQQRMQGATTDADRRKVVEDAGFADVSAADVKTELTGDSGELSDEQLGAASGAGGFALRDPYITNCWGTDLDDLSW